MVMLKRTIVISTFFLIKSCFVFHWYLIMGHWFLLVVFRSIEMLSSRIVFLSISFVLFYGHTPSIGIFNVYTSLSLKCVNKIESMYVVCQCFMGNLQLFRAFSHIHFCFCLICHFLVPKTLIFETKLRVKPFLWYWVSFVSEKKNGFTHSLIASLWNRGFGPLGYGLLISPFLFRVAHCTECRMSSSNLAKVFGPTLVGNSSTDIEPMQMLQEAKWQPKVMWEFFSLACVAGACT